MRTAYDQENAAQRFASRLDIYQQSHPLFSFCYGVVKKYSDDQASLQGALITYYGFLSLFPLLIAITSFMQLLFRHDKALRSRLVVSINHYLPVVGSELQSTVHDPFKTGLTLALGLLITLYGARGVANAIQHALNHIWEVPHAQRAGFPKGLIRSLSIIIGGGGGLLIAAVLSSYATSLGHGFIFKLTSTLISIVILFVVITFVFKVGTSVNQKLKDITPGAMIAAVGIQVLITGGGYLITHELRKYSDFYGTFDVVLGLMFWIYIQTQIFLYAAEVDTVRKLKLWPRSITQVTPTLEDYRAYKLYAQRERFRPLPKEEIDVRFDSKV